MNNNTATGRDAAIQNFSPLLTPAKCYVFLANEEGESFRVEITGIRVELGALAQQAVANKTGRAVHGKLTACVR